jgi:transposase InsO family protein
MNQIQTTQIAAALGCSKQRVLARAHAERWPTKKSGKNFEFLAAGLPHDVIEALIPDDTQEMLGENISYKQCREKDRTLAQNRAMLLSLYRSSGLSASAFVRDYNVGHVSEALHQSLGQISVATFYRWLDAWGEARIDGLVPKWYAKTSTPELLSDLAKGYLEYFYLDPRKRSALTVWRLVSGMLPNVPSYQTALRYLKSLPKPYVDYKRMGRGYFEAANNAYIERDPELYLPMDQLVSDHHCFDFLVERDGRLFRPWITAVQDYRSGRIVGFCPVVYPSSLSIALAFYIAAKRFGKTKMAHFDNGKDYRSILMRGTDRKIITMNPEGITEEEIIHIAGAALIFADDVTYTLPYHGQSKGRMERWFGTFSQIFDKFISSYVGSDTKTRPEDAALFWRAVNKQAKRHDVVTWDNFVRQLAAAVDWYNANWRGEGKGMDGRTSNELFSELAPPPRMVDEEELVLAFSRSEIKTVFENGVRLDGLSYYFDQQARYLGQQVLVRRSILKPKEAVICDVKGCLIGMAKADYFKETGDLSEDNARVRLARRKVLQLVKDSSALRDKVAHELDAFSPFGPELESQDRPQLAASGEHDPEAPGVSRRPDDRSAAFIDLLTED